MKKIQFIAILLAVLGTAALTACGTDSITADNSAAKTTAVTDVAETTAEDAAETTANAEITTAAAEKETEAVTEATDAETTMIVTEEAETTAEQVQQTEAPANEAPKQTEAPATEAPKQEQHLFDMLKLGGSSADYRASHTNYTTRESDSCLVGKDYEYTYPDFVLTVNVDNNVERIQSIKITGPGVSTREGIHIGSTRDEVQNAYGAETSVDLFTKTTADGNLEVAVQNGLVTEIFLYAL